MADIYFWRQMFIFVTTFFFSVSMGMMMSFPAVLNAAILHSNSSDIKATSDQASWIASSNGFSAAIGSLIIPPLFQLWGRKVAHIIVNACELLGWIIFTFGKDIYALYAGRIVQGVALGALYIHGTIISEYVHPKRRAYLITIKMSFVALGNLCCHVLLPFLTWRQIPLVPISLVAMALLLTCLWPESPHFLALKGRYEECKKSYYWLNGESAESEMQVKKIIEMRKLKVESKKKGPNSFIAYLKTFAEKDFRKSILIACLLNLVIDLTGRYYLFAYLFEIMKTVLEGNASVYYFSIATDVLAALAAMVSSIFTKHFSRRILLSVFGGMTATLMLLISAFIYIQTVFHLSSTYKWVTASAIILQSILLNIGITPVSFILIGEIFPLDHKGKGISAAGIIFSAFYSLTLKTTLVLMEYTGLHGTYLIFAVITTLCLVWLYRILPDTKDKTLMDIEKELADDHWVEGAAVERNRLMGTRVMDGK